jgi:hypothetical protein
MDGQRGGDLQEIVEVAGMLNVEAVQLESGGLFEEIGGGTGREGLSFR